MPDSQPLSQSVATLQPHTRACNLGEIDAECWCEEQYQLERRDERSDQAQDRSSRLVGADDQPTPPRGRA